MKKTPFSGKHVTVLMMKTLVGTGTAGDVVKVKTHFAMHVLIPGGIAVVYDKQVQNQRESNMKKIEANKAKETTAIQEAISAVEASGGVVFHKAATDADKLYDSITIKQVANFLLMEHKLNLDHSHFEMEKIEELGEYTAVCTYQDKVINIPVKVERKEEA